MSRWILPALAIITMIAAAGTLTACNTTAGAGKDVSNTGKAITRGADDVKQKM